MGYGPNVSSDMIIFSIVSVDLFIAFFLVTLCSNLDQVRNPQIVPQFQLLFLD